MFDIQKFADEEVQSAENATENFSIPEELEGISEEVAREVMAEHAEKNTEPEEPAEPEFDEEGNYTGDGKVEDVKIDYARYKETLDKSKDFEKQLKAYQEKFGDINAQPVPQQQPQYQQPAMQNYQQAVQEQKPPEPRYFTADDAKQIDDEITKTTIEMTGLTQEDIEQLDYLDDDDPKLVAWNGMKKLAEYATYNNLLNQYAQQAQAQQLQTFFNQQSQAVFDDYVQQRLKAQYRSEVQQFAGTEFFNSQNDFYKQMIQDANSRIGTPYQTAQDVQLTMDFYDKAERAYLAKQQVQTPPPVKPQKKTSPKPQFPRSEKVNGIAGSGGEINNASLAEMVKNKKKLTHYLICVKVLTAKKN